MSNRIQRDNAMTKSYRITRITPRALAALLIACFLISDAEFAFAAPDDQLAATVTDEDVEILARGPVHEAFASQVNNDAEAGIIVPNQPPEVIDEVPPEYKPDGENVIWIPGYWAWDDSKEDFIWISGVWRTAPAMKRWVPGYWHKVDQGYQWVSGFWSAQSNRAVDYRSAPPQSLESGPSTVRPTSDHFWIPGVWVHRNGFRWRPGYWCRHRADFIYTPSYWVWSPRGHIFVDGYWDYRLPARGCMFAPVYFPSPVFRRPIVRYCPSVVIDIGAMHSHWFVRPNYRHYYFGDFYDSAWAYRHHIHPGFNFHIRMGGYDPCFSYYRWHYGRMGMNYYNRMNHLHSHLHAHPHLRPGHTFGAQLSFSRSAYGRSFGISFFAHSVNNYVNHHHHGRGFVHVGLAQRRVHHDHSSTYANVSIHRHMAERNVGVNVAVANNTPPRLGRANLPADHQHKGVTQAVAVRQARLHAESQKLSMPAEIDPIRPSSSALVKPNERPRPTQGEGELAGPMRPGSTRPPVANRPGPMRTDTASVSPAKPENPGPRIETSGTVEPTVNRKGKKVEVTAPVPTVQVPEVAGQPAENPPESTVPAPGTKPNPVGRSEAESAGPSQPESARPEATRPMPKPTQPSTTEKAPTKNAPVARPPIGNGNPTKRERIEGNKPSPAPTAPINRPIADTPKS
ncbi:MAG TPA: hypothetical protein DHW38_09410, partial [Planctomycetaceae bacterium]|nr:hypothetical protein [Planctomycetaceae bacterium]